MRKVLKKMLRVGLEKLPANSLQHLLLEVEHTLGFGSGTGLGAIGLEEELSFVRKIARSEIRIIFDVGANVGNWALAARKTFQDAKIYSFEPNPQDFPKLAHKTMLDANSHVFNIGLGSVNEIKILNHNENQNSIASFVTSESMYEINNLKSEVEVRRLDDLIEESGLPIPCLIKIDVEGWEFEVLLCLGTLLKEIKFVQFEVSEGTLVAKSSFGIIQSLLISHNFVIYRHSPIGLIQVQQKIFIMRIFEFRIILRLIR